MIIDWVTWSIWLVGFLIMVVWILVPLREFKRLTAKRKAERHAGKNSNTEFPGRRSSE